MTLDSETIDALGYGTSWFSQAWAYCAHRREVNAAREATRGPRPKRERVTQSLTPGQKRSIDLWLRRGKPVSEIARKVGVSRYVVIARRGR